VARTVKRLILDPSYRRPANGRTVVGGSPLRLFTVTEAAVPVLTALETGSPLPLRHERLTDRFVDAGVAHPAPPADAVAANLVTVVVPCLGELPQRLSTALRTVVVDDGSPLPLVAPAGVELVRLPANRGPGAARNLGLTRVTTPFVAFVDADVEIDDDELLRLATLLSDDERVALAAPRVGSSDGTGVLARFERAHSPLDMGSVPARIAPTTRVSYVPAAVLVCRVDALRSIGGFDPSLRYGEDVDLTWRLVGAGWRCRYEPAVRARHRTRPSLRAWVAQRYRYGTSAGPLEQRHPGALAPVRTSPWSVATWLPVLVGQPLLGVMVGIGTSVALVRKLPSLPPAESLRLAATGNLYAGRLLARTLTRAWWPAAVAAALVSRRARRVLLVAAVLPSLVDRNERTGDLDPLRTAGLRLLDDAAYGAGVWRGVVRTRAWGALLPAFEAWPPRTGDSAAGGFRPVGAAARRVVAGCRRTLRTRPRG
jgi:mycofactocin system glycosyltransferase